MIDRHRNRNQKYLMALIRIRHTFHVVAVRFHRAGIGKMLTFLSLFLKNIYISLPVNYTPVCNLEYPQVLKSKNPLSPPLHVLSKRRNTRDHISYQTCLRSTSESKNLFFYNTFFIQFYPQQTTTNRQTRTKK